MTTKTKGPQFDGARLISAFAVGAASQVELLRQVVGEGERYAKDSAIIACHSLRERLEAKGVQVTNEDVAEALASAGYEVRTDLVKTVVAQASKRQQRRSSRDVFKVMEDSIKRARAAVKNGSD